MKTILTKFLSGVVEKDTEKLQVYQTKDGHKRTKNISQNISGKTQNLSKKFIVGQT